VKRAAPDGYTILMTTLSHNVNAILLADQKPYDPIRDFAPISLVSFLPLAMVTRADAPFNSVQDVVQAAKAKPGEVSYASAGNGGSAHPAAPPVETLPPARTTHVPSRGARTCRRQIERGSPRLACEAGDERQAESAGRHHPGRQLAGGVPCLAADRCRALGARDQGGGRQGRVRGEAAR